MASPQAEDAVDVIISGSGSAGVACALWLAIYNHSFSNKDEDGIINGFDARPATKRKPITYRVLESRDGPLQLGQADGVQCRTVEIFESFGLDHLAKAEGYWVNEVVFWAVDPNTPAGKARHGEIVRTGRTADVKPGLSHQPHLILNQARINGLMLQKMKELKGYGVDYDWKVEAVTNDGNTTHPVKVTGTHKGESKTLRAKYMLGAEGAHSQTRRSLQIPMEGDSTNAVWGVMDIFPRTNFPDVRKKTTIHSPNGILLIIPREGGSMIRTYLELPAGTDPKSVKLEELQSTASKIFQPYTFEVLKTFWWSAYSIGQRVARSMVDESGRIFLAGDACHTHSPKAGQGMNASLQDGYNIGWKLGSLLFGIADESILHTYVQERHGYAKKLIEFDTYWAKLFSSKARDDGTKPSNEEFNQAFIKGGVFTAGMAANYEGSDLVDKEGAVQSLARKIIVGERLPSAQVVRLSDSKATQLMSLIQADGRWRLLVFAGDVDDPQALPRLNEIGSKLVAADGILSKVTPESMPNDAILETLVVLKGDRTKVEYEQIHSAFKPSMHDLPIENLHKIFFDDSSWNWGHGEAYNNLEIDSEKVCIVVVRPDQYVSAVSGLDNESLMQLSKCFAQWFPYN